MTQLDRMETARKWLLSLSGTTAENAIVLSSIDGVILAWLGAAERLFGYTADEAVGMELSRLFSAEDVAGGLDKHERALAMSAGRSNDDRWHIRKDGSRFWASGILECVYDESGAVVALCKLLRDRTDLRMQYEALQRRAVFAEQQNTLHLQSLATLSHELRNQVAPMATALALLQRFETNTASVRPLEVLQRRLNVMTQLLNDLSGAAQATVRTPHLALQTLSVQSAIEQAAQALAHGVASKKQTLKVTVPEATLHVKADPARLDQMLVNLLNNASKYTGEGGAIQVSATVEAEMVAIRVEDNGAGISGDVLPHIFELFTREARLDETEGLGVGLAVVKQLVSRHGGSVEARSPGPGKGSVFTLRLPLQRHVTPSPQSGTTGHSS